MGQALLTASMCALTTHDGTEYRTEKLGKRAKRLECRLHSQCARSQCIDDFLVKQWDKSACLAVNVLNSVFISCLLPKSRFESSSGTGKAAGQSCRYRELYRARKHALSAVCTALR